MSRYEIESLIETMNNYDDLASTFAKYAVGYTTKKVARKTGSRLSSLKTCPKILSVPYAESGKNCFPK